MKKLTAEEVRLRCDAKEFGSGTSAELFPLDSIVGQNRALEALRFGLMIDDKGFNVYVAGIPGTGRTTAVSRFVKELAAKRSDPSDWCYVSNFEDPYQPRALELPSSRGWQLASHIESFIELARATITKMLESEEYATQRDDLVRASKNRQQVIAAEIEHEAQKAGFVLQGSQTGLVILPLIDGTPLSAEMMTNVPQAVQAEIEDRRNSLEKVLRVLFRKMRALDLELREGLRKMETEAVLFTLSPLIDEIEEKYLDLPRVTEWIRTVARDITENLHIFIGGMPGDSSADPNISQTASISPEEFAHRYRVNLIVDNMGSTGAPVVIVNNPSYPNLFGVIEKESRYGGLKTDFSMIRRGALHEGNGGYVVIPAEELLSSPPAYQALKRALEHDEIVIEDSPERSSPLLVKTLRPEPIPLDVKVILIGHDAVYNELYEKDPEFRQLFKVKAEFDIVMERTPENTKVFGSFICMIHQREGLRPLRANAIAEVIEYSSRLAENQAKLSTRFDIISDVIREANFYAKEDASLTVERSHIKRALKQRLFRSNLRVEKMRELAENNVILIDLQGNKVGQVNGLALITIGDYSFGHTARVTASTSPGHGRVLDIERESDLGGPIHTKGVLILGGYLSNKYGKDKPISLSSRIVFEQSYGGIDGDSASSAELFAILSSLSGVPVRQRFAVTGSVNQHGEIHAVGGINEKIEGYFELCKAKGLTGEQAILIPKANVQNLMLTEEIVDAVRADMFHIYAIRTVDEGIELLTGVSAGRRQDNGTYPPGTINALIDDRFHQMAKIMGKYNPLSANYEAFL
ncbi:MAG: Lon protease family protein [Candidatus Thorarchaeota archaeon]